MHFENFRLNSGIAMQHFWQATLLGTSPISLKEQTAYNKVRKGEFHNKNSRQRLKLYRKPCIASNLPEFKGSRQQWCFTEPNKHSGSDLPKARLLAKHKNQIKHHWFHSITRTVLVQTNQTFLTKYILKFTFLSNRNLSQAHPQHLLQQAKWCSSLGYYCLIMCLHPQWYMQIQVSKTRYLSLRWINIHYIWLGKVKNWEEKKNEKAFLQLHLKYCKHQTQQLQEWQF